MPGNDRVGLSMNEAAHRLGVGRSTIKALIARHEIRTFTIGRRRIIATSELDRFVAARLAEAAPPGLAVQTVADKQRRKR